MAISEHAAASPIHGARGVVAASEVPGRDVNSIHMPRLVVALAERVATDPQIWGKIIPTFSALSFSDRPPLPDGVFFVFSHFRYFRSFSWDLLSRGARSTRRDACSRSHARIATDPLTSETFGVITFAIWIVDRFPSPRLFFSSFFCRCCPDWTVGDGRTANRPPTSNCQHGT